MSAARTLALMLVAGVVAVAPALAARDSGAPPALGDVE